ncbi:MAG TPA: histidine kinase [Burkholderiaceae bacterium]|nr:histidine kinase [Burkholderiaceae bacterium]
MASDHPLELIPLFRRWQPGLVRDLVYTFILGAGFCLLFFGLYAYDLPRDRLLPQLWADFVIATAIAYTVHGLFVLGHTVLAPWWQRMQGWPRTAYNVVVPAGGVFAGYGIAITLLDPAAARHVIFTPGIVLSVAIVAVMVSVVLLFLFQLREREMRGKERLAAERSRALEAESRALQAQLRMLQAQIEPHFLYNTLANAVGLIQPAPERARLLLERLIDYLRATLAASRDTGLPLQREIDAITAYLELMKLRMGERLRYRIEMADAVARVPLPPMLLQPVVENAISHGLEPHIAGGEIVLSADIEHRHLRIVISDTGVGLRANVAGKVGGGVGLSNLRERIAALYGDDGSLHIATNAAGGVSVTLRLPLPPAMPTAAA